MDINIWWEALPILQKVYWLIAVPTTVVFLIQLVMLLIGGHGGDLDVESVDMDIELGHGAGLDVFTFKSIVSFLMFFGWSGLAAAESGFAAVGALLISFTVGLIMMLLTAWIFMMLLRLQENGIMRTNSSIGSTGDVYIAIPAKKAGLGKVQIVVQGALRTLDAMTDEATEIKTGALVEVIDVEGSTLIVIPKI